MDKFIDQLKSLKIDLIFDEAIRPTRENQKTDFKLIMVIPYNFPMFKLSGSVFFLKNEIEKLLPQVTVDFFFYYDFLFDMQGNLLPEAKSVKKFYSYYYQFDLTEVDMLAFSFPNSINYHHLLNILHLLAIPLEAQQRSGLESPFVVLGNNALTNPMPFADVLDAFFIGFTIDEFVHFIDDLRRFKLTSTDKAEFINSLPKYESVLLYHRDQQETKHQLGSDYMTNQNPLLFISPVIDEDKVYLTPNFGCKKACSFCQFEYMRYHEIDFDIIKPYLLKAKAKGVKTVIINSLSFTQHSQRLEILEFFKQQDMKCIIGSCRSDEMDPEYLHKLSDVIENNLYYEISGQGKKKVLTLAAESPSKQVMPVLNKLYTHETIEAAIKMGIENGFKDLCLYFMVGMDYDENVTDCCKIIDYTFDILKKYEAQLDHIMVKAHQFIPLAQTDFQRCAMADPIKVEANMTKVREYLQQTLGTKYQNRISLHYEGTKRYFYEVISSRGGREVGKALIELFHQGITPFNIHDHVETVIKIFEQFGLNYLQYYHEIPLDQPVPWESMDLVNKRLERKVNSSFHKIKASRGSNPHEKNRYCTTDTTV